MIQVKHIKKVTSFLLLLVTALMLVACSKKENVPYGNISDNEYLSVGDVTITEKELYNNLRRDSQSFLSNLIEEGLFADYREKAIGLLTSEEPVVEDSQEELVRKMFDENINQKIFNTKDLETITKLPEINKLINVENFVNGIYQIDSTVNRSDLKNNILDLINQIDLDEEIVGFYKNEVLLNLYVIDIQKHLYAQEQLELDVNDKDSGQYMDPENISSIINHYKNNEKDQYDVNVFYFYFLNINEANAAFKDLRIKTSTSGHYYEVPNIRLVAEYEKFEDEAATINALEKAGLTKHFQQEFTGPDTGITDRMFTDFYNAYSVSDSNHTKLSDYNVLNKFIELYNMVNEYDSAGVQTNGLIAGNFDEQTDFSQEDLIKYNNATQTPFESLHTREELNELNSSLASYIYKELNAEKRYSTLRSVGNRRYLVFKLSDDVHELDFVSAERDDENKEKWVTIDELKDLLADEKTQEKTLNQLKALVPEIVGTDFNLTDAEWTKVTEAMDLKIAEWTLIVKDNKLTPSYTSSKVSALLDDAKIEIYDPVIRIFFKQNNEVKGSNKTGDIVAKVKYEINGEKKELEIKVDDLFKALEKNNGLELALDLAFNKLLLNEYDKGFFKDFKDEINMNNFKKEYKELIKNFSNDGFAQAGYPASIGREAFLQIIFGATNANDAIELGYVVPKLRELFFNNVELGLGQFSTKVKNDDDLFGVLAELTELQRVNYTGVSVHHLLVFFDKDGSGTPIDPKEYLAELTTEQQEEVEKAIVELFDLILHELGNDIKGPSSGSSTSKIDVQSFVDAFNSSNGIISRFDETVRLDLHRNEKTDFQKYRKLGINLKFEDISSTITNSSNLPYQSSTLDRVFYDRAMNLYKALTDLATVDGEIDHDELSNMLPYFDFGGALNNIDNTNGFDIVLTTENLENLKSNFGYHFILVDGVSEKESAKYEPTQSEKDDPRYSFELKDKDGNEKTYNIYSDLDSDNANAISKSQIEYYILGKEKDAILPSSVEKAFNAYFQPVYSLYNGDAMKQAIFYGYLNSQSLNLGDNSERFNTLRELNKTRFNNYMNIVKDVEGSYYDSWNNLYGTWFEAFGL